VDVLFEGYKGRIGHGYDLTFFSREKNLIEAEIEAFDRIFDDTRKRLLADRPSDSTLNDSQWLWQCATQEVKKALAEIERFEQASSP
jgi:hypothetical protein